MQRSKGHKRSQTGIGWFFVFVVGMASLIFVTISLYRPDNPIATIVPGSSAEPSFVVQIVRPRQGLPLGGLLPPQLFGVDEKLGFDSSSDHAAYWLDEDLLELSGGNWKLRLVFDAAGQIQPESAIVFDLIFEDQKRRVRCKPGNLPVGGFHTSEMTPNEFSGDFEIELPICEDAETGQSLGWPPKPFILRGSFDRLPMTDHLNIQTETLDAR